MTLAVLGFLGGFLPEIMKMIRGWQDNKHELEMFKLQMQATAQMHRDELERVNVQADVAIDQLIHQPIPSYGVPFLDKMHDSGISQWFMMPLLYMYSLLDAIQVIVRPGITLALTAFYMATKWAMYQQFVGVNDADWFDAILKIYTSYDQDLLTLVISYWFGSRMAQKTLGSKAQNNGWTG